MAHDVCYKWESHIFLLATTPEDVSVACEKYFNMRNTPNIDDKPFDVSINSMAACFSISIS